MVSPQWSDKLTMLEISGGHHPLGLQGGVGPGAAEAGGRGRGKNAARPYTASGENILSVIMMMIEIMTMMIMMNR